MSDTDPTTTPADPTQPAPAPAPAPTPDPVVTAAPPTLEDRAKTCEALASAFHDAKTKSAASAALADADKAATATAHTALVASIADLISAAQAEDS